MPRGDNSSPSGMLTSGQTCSSLPTTAVTFIHRPILSKDFWPSQPTMSVKRRALCRPISDDQSTTTNATNSQSPSGDASSTFSAVPLIILALILAILILTGIFWTLIRRAKSGGQGKATGRHQWQRSQSGAGHLLSPAGDSTTPMLGHRGNGDRTDGMAPTAA
ncbi:hypothetical protein GPALN_003388 [Globodera pallida]|nr:hypothetical protein GPALN_003388 [Globodera pallida]